MPHATEPDYKHIRVTPIGPTFVAEVSGVDFQHPVPADVFAEIHRAITKHGVLVFRDAGLDDALHVQFAGLFGELDDIKPYLELGRKNRFAPYVELFDVSNLEYDGSLVKIGSQRDHFNRGNSLFHVDSSFNPRRAGFSLLRAHALPPPDTGGATDFADTRTAFDALPASLKQHLLANDYVAAHSLWHSRHKATPGSPYLEDVVVDGPGATFGRHKLVQMHEGSGRMNLYIASHVHHLERAEKDENGDERWVRVPEAEGTALIEELLDWCTQERFVVRVEWQQEGDLVVWDNTSVMHRAGPGTFAGKFARDMRRCTVHDGSSTAWGLNERNGKRMGAP